MSIQFGRIPTAAFTNTSDTGTLRPSTEPEQNRSSSSLLQDTVSRSGRLVDQSLDEVATHSLLPRGKTSSIPVPENLVNAADSFAKGLEGVDHFAIPFAVGIDTGRLAQAFQTDGDRVGPHVAQTGAKIAGAWTGALVGSQAGTQIGSAAGAAVGGLFAGVGAIPGAAIGGVVGDLIGGIGGSIAGAHIGKHFTEQVVA